MQPKDRTITDPAPRAEAAYSAAQILRFGGRELGAVRAAADEFAIPRLTAWQRRILATAFKRVGYPYIWGGTSDSRQSLFGVSVPGGYDCSGFVWRVYKLQRYAGGDALPATLQGRTTFAMSGEVTLSTLWARGGPRATRWLVSGSLRVGHAASSRGRPPFRPALISLESGKKPAYG